MSWLWLSLYNSLLLSWHYFVTCIPTLTHMFRCWYCLSSAITKSDCFVLGLKFCGHVCSCRELIMLYVFHLFVSLPGLSFLSGIDYKSKGRLWHVNKLIIFKAEKAFRYQSLMLLAHQDDNFVKYNVSYSMTLHSFKCQLWKNVTDIQDV